MKEVEPDDKWGDASEEKDPFHPDFAHIVQNITLMRIYDALMTILTDSNPEAASRLLELHRRGGLITPPPGFDPEAVYDSPSTPTSE